VLPSDEESYICEVVQAGSRKIVTRIEMELNVRAQASLSLSVYDPIDKDYTPMGSAEAVKEETFEVAVLVTFQGDFNSENVEISAAEVVDGPLLIDFGYIEPDRGDDYYR
jgi:hypothetical protein